MSISNLSSKKRSKLLFSSISLIVVFAMVLSFSLHSELFKKNVFAETIRDMTTVEIVGEMGLGINLGNTLESNGEWIEQWTDNNVSDYETAWGSPIITKAMIKGYADAGFKTVRVPVGWSNRMGDNYTIDSEYTARVKEIVDMVIENDMYAIVNIHHDGGWWENFPTDETGCMTRYERMWTQIADTFKGYGDHLILESLNEEGGWDSLWNPWSGTESEKMQSYSLLNRINQKFVDIVRNSGGNNAERHLLIAGYKTDIDRTTDSLFKMPNDPKNRCAVSVHYYDPFGFTHLEEDESWASMTMTWGTDAEKAHLSGQIQKLKTTFIDKGTPVIVGEYGFASNLKRDDSEIRNYTLAVAEAFYEADICPVLWDVQQSEETKSDWYYYDRNIAKFIDDELAQGFKTIMNSKGGNGDNGDNGGDGDGNDKPVRYEAEGAKFGGGGTPEVVSEASASGGKYVSMKEGDLSFTVNAPEAGNYAVNVSYSLSDDYKQQMISVNSNVVGSVSFNKTSSNGTDFKTIPLLLKVYLNEGENTVDIQKYWGWVNIDYIEVSKFKAAPFSVPSAPVNKNATTNTKKVYSFLRENFTKKIISGVMTNEVLNGNTPLENINDQKEVAFIKKSSGKTPALIGFDFMHSTGLNSEGQWYKAYTEGTLKLAEDLFKKGGIPTFSWHWKDPSDTVEAFYTKSDSKPEGTTFDSKAILDKDSSGYAQIIADIDEIAAYLKTLNDKDIPVLWRPLHEAAGGWFWWGANGAEANKEIWKIMYERLVDHHKLNNLIWVWTCDGGANALDWYPGDEYVDIVGMDFYYYPVSKNHSSLVASFEGLKSTYQAKKIIALSENGSIPYPENLIEDEAGWSWFMPWYGEHTGTNGETAHNVASDWNKVMNHEYVLALEDMTGWDGGNEPSSSEPDSSTSEPNVSTTEPDISTSEPDSSTTEPDPDEPTPCGRCGKCDLCKHLFKKGHVLGNDTIGIGDALEVLMYLAKMSDSLILKTGKDAHPWNAALIISNNKPCIADALQILMYLSDMPCKLN